MYFCQNDNRVQDTVFLNRMLFYSKIFEFYSDFLRKSLFLLQILDKKHAFWANSFAVLPLMIIFAKVKEMS